MHKETFRNFLKITVEYKLYPREMQVLQWFLEKPWRVNELVDQKGVKKMAIYHVIQRLERKNAIIRKSRDFSGNNVYVFNEELLKKSSSP